MLVLYCVSISFSLGNKTATILLINYSSVDGFFSSCLYHFKTEKNLDSFPLFLTGVEAYFSFRAVVLSVVTEVQTSGFGLNRPIPRKYARVVFRGVFSSSWRLWIFCRGVFSILFKPRAQPTLCWSSVKLWWNVTPYPSCLCSFLVLTARAALSVPQKLRLFLKGMGWERLKMSFSQAATDILTLSFLGAQ